MSHTAKTPNTPLRTALFTVPLIAIGVLGTAAAPAEATTSPAAKSLTCRGKGVDPQALVRYRTETVIHAPLRTIWKLQTEVERWPAWQDAVTTMERLDHGPFRKGSAFRRTTPIPPNPATPATSLDITSTVEQLKQPPASAGPAPRSAKVCASAACTCGTSPGSRAASA